MSPKNKRVTLLIVILLIVTIVLALIFKTLQQNVMFFVTPTELQTTFLNHNQTVRVGGVVKKIQTRTNHDFLTFTLTDCNSSITVKYDGVAPNLFREGQGIIATGSLNEEKIFIAKELLTKHDEQYMPSELYKTLRTKTTCNGKVDD